MSEMNGIFSWDMSGRFMGDILIRYILSGLPHFAGAFVT
jgi:hypothetical protein